MLVVLISPYSGIEATGLRILSACLKHAGFQTRMIFLPSDEEVMAGTHYGKRDIAPDVSHQITALCEDAGLIGISVMTPAFRLAGRLTQDLHAALNVPVIWGGVHPTVRPDECLQFADLVCVGEGERAIVELAQRLAAGQDYRAVNNLAYHDATGHTVVNALSPLETDLDKLPFPDYEYEQHYVLHDGSVIPFTQRLMHYYLTDLGSWASGPVYRTLTTRGCPYKCAFCVNSSLIETYPDWSKLRRRSPANVVAELKAVRERLPAIEAVVLNDDTFLATPVSYIAEFCEQYRREIGLPFRAYTTAQTADAVKLQHLAEAGLRYIIMGIQSGSARIQQLYGRNTSNEQMLHAAHVIHAFQKWAPRPTYDIISDNPYETTEDRLQTLELVHRLPAPYRLSLYSLTFYPGTPLHRRASGDGHIGEDDRDSYEHNFQILRPNYYNFALFCHSLNLPRPLLFFLSRRWVFRLFSREPLNSLFGQIFKCLVWLRLRNNKRLYSRRRAYWLSAIERKQDV